VKINCKTQDSKKAHRPEMLETTFSGLHADTNQNSI